MAEWNETDGAITKFSIVGYSLGIDSFSKSGLILGGLISRYAVGLLYSRGVFEKIQPVNFTTFATPHLGIRHINPGIFHNLANFLGPKVLSSSGRQMFIADRTPRPILLRMAEKGIIPQEG